MGWQYSDKTKKLFMDAVQGAPGTHLGEIPSPDGLGEHGSIACGDAIKFTFKVDKHASDPLKDVIVLAKYLTFGCTSAIASSEALCSIIEQKRLSPVDALKITNQDIVDFLGGLPEQKIHCSVMGAEALEAAVIDWAQKRGVDLRSLGINIGTHEEIDEGRLVCQCFSLTDVYLKRKIKELNLQTLDAITHSLKAGGACQACKYKPGGLQDILNEVWGSTNANNNKTTKEESMSHHPDHKHSTDNSEEKVEASPYQLGKKVENVIAEKIRPLLQRDGGDIEVVDIKDYIIYCQLQGACSGCMGAQMTLKMMVERILKEDIDQRIKVISV
ncbi:MAG: iron-sulfur cluster assembly scaffold protein [Oligoflexia bacterium]|nr:iron-sulfur cluster assembly scaffold protein [Oligoflexia bacterium]MBF0366543.1 iron-sulfur cluster assembly scaffold protein [Oligoflexia bacterium]